VKKKDKDIFNPFFKTLPPQFKVGQTPAKKTPPTPPKKKEGEWVEKELFLQAMSDVAPFAEGKRDRRPPGTTNRRPAHPAPDEEQEVMNHLYGLVAGRVEMDITFSDEYMEGSVRGLSRKIMKRLKRGEIPVQDHIDLHGLTRQGAEEQVREFLVQSHKLGLRCVLIVHGRGLNSPDSFPVLKEGLPLWLGRGPAKRIVLAFATARPYDGGTGAVYVLLRKR